MLLNVLVVDDEPLAREGLRMLLTPDPDIGTVREAKDGHEAVAAIRAAPPDLVFLDVQMPEMDGFGVIREIGAEHMPPVVFVTAHDRYAIRAFEINAIDYLLKPITEERFAKTLARIKGPATEPNHKILSLLETLASPSPYARRLAVRAAGKTTLIDVAEIDAIEAAENYVQLNTSSGHRPLMHVTMSTIERALDPQVFMRVHRSMIINITRVRDVECVTHSEYVITLKSGLKVRSGRNYAGRIKALVANPF